MTVNYARMVKLFEDHGPDTGTNVVRESFANGMQTEQHDLAALFEACFGRHNQLAARNGASIAQMLTEAQGAVSTTAFTVISGQIVYSAFMERYRDEQFVFKQLIPEVMTNLSGEKIAGISRIGDQALVVPEGEPYPQVGVREDWVRTPETKKRGFEIGVTREAYFFDRTGQLRERVGEGGYWMGVNEEKRAIDCVIDENTTDHRYNWRDNIIASYGDNSGTHTWDNLNASNGLSGGDWSKIDSAIQVFNALIDPNTGEPIDIQPKHIIAALSLERTIARILSATEIRVATPGFATTGSPTQTTAPNPYLNRFTYVGSRLLAARMALATSWYIGDVGRYARRMINWRMQQKEAAPNSYEEFHRDVVQQFRWDERSAFTVVEPRAIVKNTA